MFVSQGAGFWKQVGRGACRTRHDAMRGLDFARALPCSSVQLSLYRTILKSSPQKEWPCVAVVAGVGCALLIFSMGRYSWRWQARLKITPKACTLVSRGSSMVRYSPHEVSSAFRQMHERRTSIGRWVRFATPTSHVSPYAQVFRYTLQEMKEGSRHFHRLID